MGMQYDVKATAIAAAQTDSAVFAGPARIKGMVIGVPTAGGTLTLKKRLSWHYSIFSCNSRKCRWSI